MQTIDLMHPDSILYKGTVYTDTKIKHSMNGFNVYATSFLSGEVLLKEKDRLILQYKTDLYGQPLDKVENIKYTDWWDFTKKGVYRINFHDR